MKIKTSEALQQLADLLPANVCWGDGLTPPLLVDILDKYVALRQEQPEDYCKRCSGINGHHDYSCALSQPKQEAHAHLPPLPEPGRWYCEGEPVLTGGYTDDQMREYAHLASRQSEFEWLTKAAAALQAQNNALEKELASRQADTLTDLSKRLRANSSPRHPQTLIATRDLLAACDEIERYYGGMMAWKKVAEEKDRQPAAQPVPGADILGAIGRGWCSKGNASKVMDNDIALAIYEELKKLSAAPAVVQPVPDDYAIVPYQVSPVMVAAFINECQVMQEEWTGGMDGIRDIWLAMIAAAQQKEAKP